jgi:hypothetical protein
MHFDNSASTRLTDLSKDLTGKIIDNSVKRLITKFLKQSLHNNLWLLNARNST